jgi:predicted DNA-binding ribbon-helix-helix protein
MDDREQLSMPERAKYPRGKSQVAKRSVRVGANYTSIAMEAAFWDALKSVADAQGIPVNQLVATIDKDRRKGQYKNLSSAIRLFVLDYYWQQNGRGAVRPQRPKGPRGRSQVFKGSIYFGGVRTSVTLEHAFWGACKEIAAAQGTPVSHLIATIDKERRERHYPNLPSAIRLFVLEYYRSRMQP